MSSKKATVGDNIKRARAAIRLTQEGLAKLVGVSVDTIRAIEQGKNEAPRDFTPYVAALGKSEQELRFGWSEVVYDRDAEIDRIAMLHALTAEQRTLLSSICRSIGQMTEQEIENNAKAIARNAATDGLAHPKNVDRTEVDPKRDRGNLKAYKG